MLQHFSTVILTATAHLLQNMSTVQTAKTSAITMRGMNSLQCFWSTADNWDLGFGCTWLVLAEKKNDNMTWTSFVIFLLITMKGNWGENKLTHLPSKAEYVLLYWRWIHSWMWHVLGVIVKSFTFLPLSVAKLQAYVRMHTHTEPLHTNTNICMNTYTPQCLKIY